VKIQEAGGRGRASFHVGLWRVAGSRGCRAAKDRVGLAREGGGVAAGATAAG
jgi:hypothetical protein